jgi:hypothetical protein
MIARHGCGVAKTEEAEMRIVVRHIAEHTGQVRKK